MKKVAAAIMLFTRLPLWRLVKTSGDDYSDAVVFWPLVGWITAGITALSLICFSQIVSGLVAAVLVLCVRLLLTGAFHEDGLADFFDAFGGGGSKERILAIMKDSHIGTYGVIALIVYIFLWVSIVSSLPTILAATAIVASDPFCKLCAGQLTNTLPYARPESSKNKVTYIPMSAGKILFQIVFGILPLVPLYCLSHLAVCAALAPILIFLCMRSWMKHRIGGYTGDCCGATYLMCELAMLLTITVIINFTL